MYHNITISDTYIKPYGVTRIANNRIRIISNLHNNVSYMIGKHDGYNLGQSAIWVESTP